MKTSKKIMVLGILVIFMLVISVISINSGKMSVAPFDVWQVFLGKGTPQQQLIVFEFRIPRIVLAIFVGIGMGISGVIMQSLLKNDMASPGTLGISSGSGLFVLIYLVVFHSESVFASYALPILSFIGGILSALLIFFLSYKRNKEMSPTTLILTGVAVGSGYSALTTMLSLRMDERQMEFMQKWQAGNLWGDDWVYLKVLIPWITILVIYSIYKSQVLNAIHLGDETAKGLGVSVKKEFIVLMLVAVALSSGSVALGGNFFFVGMIAPHIARKIVGANHFYVLPASGLIGAIIILLADTITRSLSLGSDIPTGIVITVLSTPYFLYLLSKSD
ncbi:FecCD family ABC transporter permease [Vagococcus hydrophili]|uniref:Iron ABC transporter permease n=1 Tax=Vagococcus hydrophili TaxID=2714947 RepID=A0A6G8AT92_9ENTE|nr:iron ABC transporter permease [Vagococcus hydrophili]QIL48284.1 iron ABC transporter permease [Vagococcus hydrophili]